MNYADFDTINPAPRCPVFLLLGTSASMSGEPIKELNNGLRRFVDEVSSNEAAGLSVELEVIEFSQDTVPVIPMTGIRNISKQCSLVAKDPCQYRECHVHMPETSRQQAKNLSAKRHVFIPPLRYSYDR